MADETTTATATETAPVETPAPAEAPPTEARDTGQTNAEGERLYEVTLKGKPAKLTQAELDELHDAATNPRAHRQAANDAFREAAKVRKEAETQAGFARAIIEAVKRGPEGVKALAQHLGLDPYDLAEAIVAEKAAMAAMTPEQRAKAEIDAERAKLRREREELDAERAKREDEARTKALDVETQQWVERWQKAMPVALRKAGVDVNPDTLEAFARLAADYVEEGIEVEPDDVAAEVAEKYTAHVGKARTFHGSDGKPLHGAALLAAMEKAEPTLVKRVSAAIAESLKSPVPVTHPRPAAPKPAPKAEPKRPAVFSGGSVSSYRKLLGGGK